jgi:hypothetical protein
MLLRVFILLAMLMSTPAVATQERDSPFPLADLIERGFEISSPLSVEEIERASLAEFAGLARVPQVPFGFKNAEWETFKSRMEPGDVIVRARSSAASWAGLAGWRGLLLVRAGLVVEAISEAVS